MGTCVNAMLHSLIDNNLSTQCIQIYEDNVNGNDKLNADRLCFAAMLRACTHSSMFEFGQEIHAKIKKKECLSNDSLIQKHLINFYGKCGFLNVCNEIFANVQNKEIGHYECMLYAFGRNSDFENALFVFERIKAMAMQSNTRINCKTIKLMMSACSHCGKVSKAMNIWCNDIVNADNIKFDVFVVSSLVDCLSRNGHLNKAKNVIAEYENFAICNSDYSNIQMWTSLLNGCKKTNNIKMAETVLNEIMHRFDAKQKNEFEDDMISINKLMSHIYASNQEFDKMNKIRMKITKKKQTKYIANSNIFINGKLNEFVAGRSMFDQQMANLTNDLKKAYNFKHDFSALTKEFDNESNKELELRRHSEKLALMFALLNCSNDSQQIVINNNLRMCNDCHSFFKLVSKQYNKKLIVSDPNRVHLFENGKCVCMLR